MAGNDGQGGNTIDVKAAIANMEGRSWSTCLGSYLEVLTVMRAGTTAASSHDEEEGTSLPSPRRPLVTTINTCAVGRT